ncbi:restriction endonuclease subunit S [Asticcacaulis sp. AC460]|uniref:restriction endonuclease subunit S n=1 Tax=Asticcacaulis sp. AC460 TaxID=1282360 RepID=UPI00138ADFCD|nr:restriction endonuclease subunit S [Asticcacaulis sp. AC460]
MAIEEFCLTGSGGTPSRSNDEFYGGNIPWVKSGELREKVVVETEEAITEEALAKSSAKLVPAGAILLAMYGATVGRLALLGIDAATNQAVCNIRPDHKVADTAYVYRALEAKVPELIAMATGGAQPNISQDKIRKLKIPLPPLDEQKRIAAILDKADQLRQKRRQAIALLDSLTQSIFLEMFGDPIANPYGWPAKPLDECILIDAPLVDPRLTEYCNLLHYGPDRIEKESGRLLPAKTALEDNLISKKFLCSEKHILYSKIRPYLNKVALSPGQCLCSADMYPVEPKQHVMDNIYLWFMLRTSAFLGYAESCSGRANIPKINREQLLGFEILVPSLADQKSFGLLIGKVQRETSRQELSLSSVENLFSSLQHRAFSGQL